MVKKYLKLGSTLKKLLFERDMRPVELSREVNLPPTTIHRLITGKSTRPYQSSLQPIADFFSVSIDQLLGESPLVFEKNVAHQYQQMHFLPFIAWSNLNLVVDKQKMTDHEKIPFIGNSSAHAFATTVNDSAMEPQFFKNSMLIFDPEKNPIDRSYVLVQLENNIFIFRQLLIDATHFFLKPLNPDLTAFKMRILGKNDRIAAVLVEARHNYNA